MAPALSERSRLLSALNPKGCDISASEPLSVILRHLSATFRAVWRHSSKSVRLGGLPAGS